MKKIYYSQHDASDLVWRDKLTEEEVNAILETPECVDLISKEIFKLRIEQGWSVEY